MNPIVRLYDAPVATLTDAGWALVLLAALIATWWAAGRNAEYAAGMRHARLLVEERLLGEDD